MAFWGVEVKPGKPFTHSPDKAIGRLRVSQATLGIGPASNNKSLVQCNVGKKSPVLLCCLLPGVLESCHLELEFEEVEGVTFSVLGSRSVHLTGYYVSNVRKLGEIEESESFGEDIGDTDTERSDGRNDEDEYEDSFIDDGEPEEFPSPSFDEVASKKKNKKKTKKNKADSPKQGHRRLRKKYELSESEDDYVPSELETSSEHIGGPVVISDDDDGLPISSVLGKPKTSTEDTNRKVCISDEDQSEERKGKGKKRKSKKESEAPAASTAGEDQSGDRKAKDKKRKCGEKNEAPAVSTAGEDQSEDRKVKKKKRKSGKENQAPTDTERTRYLEDSGTDLVTKPRETKTEISKQTLSGGLIVEELEIGDPDAKVASSGKKVSIHYTGKLKEGGRVFDSTVGKDPLKFRLGKGEALDGLDLGIEGMRVGGKRRLIIPPALGFGDEGSERVPPNSWLVMDVELLRVR